MTSARASEMGEVRALISADRSEGPVRPAPRASACPEPLSTDRTSCPSQAAPFRGPGDILGTSAIQQSPAGMYDDARTRRRYTICPAKASGRGAAQWVAVDALRCSAGGKRRKSLSKWQWRLQQVRSRTHVHAPAGRDE